MKLVIKPPIDIFDNIALQENLNEIEYIFEGNMGV